MKNESEFCTIIRNSMQSGFKIPDASGSFTSTSMRAFDGIGLLPECYTGESDDPENFSFICWEGKFMKVMGAFSFSRIEAHQAQYLYAYQKAKNVYSYVILGMDLGRNDKRAYVFEVDDLFIQYFTNGLSIHKKYLEQLPYEIIKKGKFEFNRSNLITSDKIQNLYKDVDINKFMNSGAKDA